jgi:hypothetical protein
MSTMATRQQRAREEYQTPAQLMVDSALLLLSGLPRDRRAGALRTLVRTHRQLHAGLPTPDWIEMLAELAEGEGN